MNIAALLAPVILAIVQERSLHTWVCRYCGGKTSLSCEICSLCHIEDCSQGDLRWPNETAYLIEIGVLEK